MTAACVALNKIESSTATSVALAVYVRRVRDSLLALTIGKTILKVLNFRLNNLTRVLRSGVLDRLSQQQLTELAKLLKTLDTALVRIFEDDEIRAHHFLRNDVENLAQSRDDVESILENICLAIDPNFRDAVSLAIGELRIGVEESAALPR